MKTTKHQISPLRQRMIEDMQLRKLAPKTQSGYIRNIKKLGEFLGHSPHTATAKELRAFQLNMANNGTSRISMNAALIAIRFLFNVTLNKPECIRDLKLVSVPRKLPIILSREEVARLIEATEHPKYRAIFSVAYGAGLRISEIAALKIADIDSDRMTLHIEQGKGRKDRYAMLSPALLQCLRDWWFYGHEHRLLLNGGWLFPGQNPVNPISNRQLGHVCRLVTKSAGLDKRVSMHMFRHAFATHLLEQGVDIRVIQVLLGHSKLETTSLYTQVATKLLKKVTSPLELLPVVK
ncbi:MAG: tyrosine-type recombinase/integrase [Proteobacteria bacterium]|nr:tyrosine-type recombinase/integrase [Pseudomonadota bacterium]